MIIPVLEGDIREVSPSVLAYVGDAVFELYVRLHLAARIHSKSGALHRQAIVFVRAEAQARAARSILDSFSEEEASVFRRAKNSNPTSLAKNASPADYKYATGLEAVIGYLYLTDQNARLDEVLRRILIEETNGSGEGERNGKGSETKSLH